MWSKYKGIDVETKTSTKGKPDSRAQRREEKKKTVVIIVKRPGSTTILLRAER